MNCCSSTAEGRSCGNKPPPCVTVDPTCSRSDHIQSAIGPYCCDAECGACGGEGCSSRPGGMNCCSSTAEGRSCAIEAAPCVTVDPTCSRSDHIKSAIGPYRCDAECGACGGSGCSARPGGMDCCFGSAIGRSCAEYLPPCIVVEGAS